MYNILKQINKHDIYFFPLFERMQFGLLRDYSAL